MSASYTLKRTEIIIRNNNDYHRAIETRMLVIPRMRASDDALFRYVVGDEQHVNSWSSLPQYDTLTEALEVHDKLVDSIVEIFGKDKVEIIEGWSS